MGVEIGVDVSTYGKSVRQVHTVFILDETNAHAPVEAVSRARLKAW
jgi:hypothetical protein